jgi:hypothetical protein
MPHTTEVDMNELIKRLLVQAHGEAENLKDTNWIANRFAELIVRECAKVVFEKTGPKSALNVLEHFGVEE